jgi:hypothetical protein
MASGAALVRTIAVGLVRPAASGLQAIEIPLKRGLDRSAICSEWQCQELIGRDAAISRILDYWADGVPQGISFRTRSQGDKAFVEEGFDVANG